jgi:hypothetical protein
MRRVLGFLSGLAAGGFLLAGSAQATTITFDDVAISSPPAVISIEGDRYADLGVLLATDGNRGLSVYGIFTDYLEDGGQAAFGNQNGFARGSLVITFVDPLTGDDAHVAEASVRVADVQTGSGSSWLVQFFDIDLNMIHQETGTSNDEVDVSFSDEGPSIHRIVFFPSVESEAIDTISFSALVTPPPVPEPGTFASLALGTLGLWARLGRRSRRAS